MHMPKQLYLGLAVLILLVLEVNRMIWDHEKLKICM